MSRARPIVPGTTYLLTRRCVQRQFWLLPTGPTTQIIMFCLAVAAEKFGVRIHAVGAMSNHVHIVLTDVHGRAPAFYHWAFKFIGTVVNASLGRWGSLFEQSEKTSLVRLTTEQSILDAIAYTCANPVAAGLVETDSEWPGLCRYYDGKERKAVARPKVYFRDNGNVPKSAHLELVRPPVMASESDADVIKKLRKCVNGLVRKERKRIHKSGRRFVGAAGVLRQKRWLCPETRERRRKISPRVAGKNKWARAEALMFLQELVHRILLRA